MADNQDAFTNENAAADTNVTFSYIGEEELRFFLALVNKLCEAKFMPVDKPVETARTAVEANRLSQSVLINGQMFDGTQNITFEDFAKKTDVLSKADRAIIGGDNNGNKVVTLDSEGKVNSSFLDMDYIQEKVNNTPVKNLEATVEQYRKDYTDDIGALKASAENQKNDMMTVKNYIGMKQAKAKVAADILPASAIITGVEFKSYCMPPLEVLKDIGASKTGTLNYALHEYNKNHTFSNCTVTSDSITVKPAIVPMFSLLTNDSSNDVAIVDEHPIEKFKSQLFDVDGKTYCGFRTCSFSASKFSELAKLSLVKPDCTHYYGVIADNKTVYHVKNGALESCDSIDLGTDHRWGADTIVTLFRDVMTSTANASITMDMIRSIKASSVMILLCTEKDVELTSLDMTVDDFPKTGYAIETDCLLNTYFKKIKKFTPHATCTDSIIRFGLKRISSTADEYAYSVWNKESQSWKDVASKKDIAAAGAPVEELSNIPAEKLNVDDANYSLVFVFLPDNMDSVCTLNVTDVSYTDAFCYEKALHGTDYTYVCGERGINVVFLTEGNYLVNYPVTDILPLYDRETTELTLKHTTIE